MVTVPILAMLDFLKEFVVEIDVSSNGLDTMLKESSKVSLQAQVDGYSHGISKMMHYLLGRHFKVHTD